MPGACTASAAARLTTGRVARRAMAGVARRAMAGVARRAGENPAVPTARSPVLLVLAAGALFGTAGTAQALGPAGTSPLGVGILRIVVGALALLVAMPLLGTPVRGLGALWRTPAMWATAACAASYQLFFFAGVQRAGVALGTLVAVGSAPVLAGLLGWAVLGHRPTRGWLGATLVCLVGLVMLTGPQASGAAATGLLLALGAGGCIAGYNVAAKVQLDRGAGALEVPAGSFLLGGALLLPVLATQPLEWLAQPSGIALALYLGVATMGLANVLLTRGMRSLTAGPVTTLMLADPAVATVLGVVVLDETLVPLATIGVVLVFAGLFLQGVLAARGPRPEPEPIPVL